jgi:hypothetical protein
VRAGGSGEVRNSTDAAGARRAARRKRVKLCGRGPEGEKGFMQMGNRGVD